MKCTQGECTYNLGSEKCSLTIPSATLVLEPTTCRPLQETRYISDRKKMTPKIYSVWRQKDKAITIHYKTFVGLTSSNVLPLLLLNLSAYTLGWPSHVQCPHVWQYITGNIMGQIICVQCIIWPQTGIRKYVSWTWNYIDLCKYAQNLV